MRRRRDINQRIDIKMYSSLIFLYDNLLVWLPILMTYIYVASLGYFDRFLPDELIYYKYPYFYTPFLVPYMLVIYWLWYIFFAPGFEYEDEDIKPTSPENIRHHEMTKLTKRVKKDQITNKKKK